MNAREAIRFLTGSPVRPTVLRATATPATPATLTKDLPHSRRSIVSAVEWYETHGWMRNDTAGYVQTAIGSTIAREFETQASSESRSSSELSKRLGTDAAIEAKRNEVQSVVNSELRERMLRCESLPRSSSALGSQFDTSPSTAFRVLQSLKGEGWFEKRDGLYYRTDDGKTVLGDFDALVQIVEQAMDKRACLRWLDPEIGDLPVRRLGDARQAVSDTDYIDAGKDLFEELVQSDFDQYRGMITYVSTSAAESFSPQIDNGVQAELLVTPSVLHNLPIAGNPAQLVQNGLRAKNFDMQIANDLPLAMSIFDDDVVFFGPRPQDIQESRNSVIVSADGKVIEWAIDLYDKYRDLSRRPSEHVVYSLLDRLDPSPRLSGLLDD